MRRGLVLGLGLGLLNGALAIGVVWWLGRRGSGEFGWYAYAPLTRSYSAYAVVPGARLRGWELALLLLVAFVVVNAAAITATLYLKRRRTAASG